MSDDGKPTPKPEKTPGDTTPHDPGISPKPGEPANTKPAEGAPYDKAADPSQQPS